MYYKFKEKFRNITDPSTLGKEEMELYKMWKKSEQQIAGDPKEQLNFMLIKNAYKEALAGDSIIKKQMGKSEYTGADVESFVAANDEGKKAKRKILTLYNGLGIDLVRTNKQILTEIGEYVAEQERKAEASEKEPKDYRGEIVKDNYYDFNDRFYGNNDVMANTPYHGTHVSGIIAAARNNGRSGWNCR